MSKPAIIQDKYDALAKNYEKLLEEFVHQAKSKTHDTFGSVWHDIQMFTDMNLEQATHLQHALSRDLADAKQYMRETDRELKFWLGFEFRMLKADLWQKFQEATDVTPIEILQFSESDSQTIYKSGELIGLGTLECDQCNKLYYFTYPSNILACAQCNGSHFHRVFNEVH